ncbi:MAG: gamma-glutamyltransferase family protein [Negativicutes bacterium]
MNFDAMFFPHPSRRLVTFAKNGMVATSQSLAAQAGLDILKKGGNAIDAAIATAACLTVVEPTQNGIGGDAFALVWSKNELHGLNASGPAPRRISRELVVQAGHKTMPVNGWLPVTVPGIPSAWAALSARFGRLELSEVLKPAIEYAANGYPVSSVVSKHWKQDAERYSKVSGEEFRYWWQTFAPQGKAPDSGEMCYLPDHAKTLAEIGSTRAESFYRGNLAAQIDAFSAKYGGYLRGDDLAAFYPEWVTPIKVNYRGYDIWEIPPNGHGLVALMALNILNGLDLDANDPVEYYHRQIEAMKLAFADGKQYIAEPEKMQVSVEELLSANFAAVRRSLIGNKALEPKAGDPRSGGTVYLATADSEGNMVSYIQSNYMGFGSGLVVPGTGISLHNRGCNFSLDEHSDNCLEPGKRSYHTIIPGFLTKDGQAVGPFGVMGAFMQPQGHVQVAINTIDAKLNPQAALDAPRWQWTGGKTIEVEPHFPSHIAEALARRGHDIKVNLDPSGFGRGQIIWRSQNNVLSGGTEPRADGVVAAW